MDHLASTREVLDMMVRVEHSVKVIIEQQIRDGNLVGTLLNEGTRDKDSQMEEVAWGEKGNYRVLSGVIGLRKGSILE